MNENKKSFLSFIFIILSLILSYLGFSNLRYMESSYFNLTRENSSLIEKRNKTQENIKNLSQEINLKNSKLDVITREIEKFDVLQNKSTEIEDLNKELGDSLIPFQNDREFKFFEISKDKINSFTPLRGNFIDKNLNREDMEDNLRLMPFFCRFSLHLWLE